MLAGTNFVLHGAGWLEGGLASGYEKFVMDTDQLGMMQKLSGGVDLSENGQALDAIREVGPGSHFLGCAHTQANFETRSEEHTSELQSLMRISYAVFSLKKKHNQLTIEH